MKNIYFIIFKTLYFYLGILKQFRSSYNFNFSILGVIAALSETFVKKQKTNKRNEESKNILHVRKNVLNSTF